MGLGIRKKLRSAVRRLVRRLLGLKDKPNKDQG